MRNLITGLLPLLLFAGCLPIDAEAPSRDAENKAQDLEELPSLESDIADDLASDGGGDSLTVPSYVLPGRPDVPLTTHPINQDNLITKPPVTFAPFSPGAGTSRGDGAKLVSTFGTFGGGRATVGGTRLHTFSNPLVLIF